MDYDFFDEHVVQTVYPLASPDPVIYLPPGQELYGSRIPSRWLVAPSDLRRTLARLGAPLKELALGAGRGDAGGHTGGRRACPGRD